VEEKSKHLKTCIKCKENFYWTNEQSKWDYTGFTDTKIVICSHCGCKNPIKYIEHINPNYDRRYFD
jgi:hypothetical protein